MPFVNLRLTRDAADSAHGDARMEDEEGCGASRPKPQELSGGTIADGMANACRCSAGMFQGRNRLTSAGAWPPASAQLCKYHANQLHTFSPHICKVANSENSIAASRPLHSEPDETGTKKGTTFGRVEGATPDLSFKRFLRLMREKDRFLPGLLPCFLPCSYVGLRCCSSDRTCSLSSWSWAIGS